MNAKTSNANVSIYVLNVMRFGLSVNASVDHDFRNNRDPKMNIS